MKIYVINSNLFNNTCLPYVHHFKNDVILEELEQFLQYTNRGHLSIVDINLYAQICWEMIKNVLEKKNKRKLSTHKFLVKINVHDQVAFAKFIEILRFHFQTNLYDANQREYSAIPYHIFCWTDYPINPNQIPLKYNYQRPELSQITMIESKTVNSYTQMIEQYDQTSDADSAHKFQRCKVWMDDFIIDPGFFFSFFLYHILHKTVYKKSYATSSSSSEKKKSYRDYVLAQPVSITSASIDILRRNDKKYVVSKKWDGERAIFFSDKNGDWWIIYRNYNFTLLSKNAQTKQSLYDDVVKIITGKFPQNIFTFALNSHKMFHNQYNWEKSNLTDLSRMYGTIVDCEIIYDKDYDGTIHIKYVVALDALARFYTILTQSSFFHRYKEVLKIVEILNEYEPNNFGLSRFQFLHQTYLSLDKWKRISKFADDIEAKTQYIENVINDKKIQYSALVTLNACNISSDGYIFQNTTLPYSSTLDPYLIKYKPTSCLTIDLLMKKNDGYYCGFTLWSYDFANQREVFVGNVSNPSDVHCGDCSIVEVLYVPDDLKNGIVTPSFFFRNFRHDKTNPNPIHIVYSVLCSYAMVQSFDTLLNDITSR